MQDDEITLCNACTDLVSLKKTEAFPLHLLGSKRLRTEWTPVRELCQTGKRGPRQFGVRTLCYTWLPGNPMAPDQDMR